MGCTLKKGSSGGQPDIDLNLVLNTIGKQVNRILQNQTKNLETTISYQARMIRQSMNEQTKYLKTIADNLTMSSTQVPQIKMGQIKNENEKPIKMTHQSINVQLQQSLQQKQSIQKNQKNIIEQNKPIKINEMISQTPQLYLQKITEIYSRIQRIQLTQFQFIKDQLHPQKNSPIALINKNLNQIQKFNAIELLDNHEKNQGNIDYKDRFLVMPLVGYEKYSKLNLMDPWISDLYEKLSEEAFYGYLHKHMTKEQMKVFFSQNLILDTVKMMRLLIEKNKQISIKQILKKLSDLSGPALEFQLKKYPQKKKIFIRPQIQNMVQSCQIHEDPQYDILINMKFRYQYEENGIYYKQIKLMINKIISLTNQHFQSYREQMKKIFTLKQQKLTPEYIQHQIGRKINQNTPQFQEHQINTNKITIQSPQIMRIIIKWIQGLEDKIQNLAKNIENRYYPFIALDGSQIKYTRHNREDISKRFKKYLNRHNQYKLDKNFEVLQNIEIQMINYIDTNSKGFSYLSQNNTEVGLITHLLSETVQEIAIKRVNQILHSILSFQKQQKYFCDANYISFSVYDLLRSRCTGNYQKIKKVYDQLKQNTNFKIIRVKNRLATGNRDFLINMKFKNTPIICELQLGLILEASSINQKQDRLGDFNHFLYELKRSKYGPLTQAVMLNAHYSQSITFFQEKLKKIKIQKEKNMKIQSLRPKIFKDEIQIIGYKIQVEQIIFVCHNCLQVKYTKTSFLNTYKKMKKHREGQFQYLCGQCVVNSLSIFDRNKYLLGDYITQYFQQTNQDEILKNYQMVESCYYLIISTNRRKYVVRKLEQHYFIQCFSSLVSQKYQFLKINQLGIKYVYRLTGQINNQNNIIKIHNIQELNKRAYINQQKREFLINNKEKWKQTIGIKGKKGYLLIDASKEQNAEDYKSNLNLFIKTKQIKKFKQLKIQYMDFENWCFSHKFFQQNLKDVKQIKKLNLSDNNLTDINQIIKGKNILELLLNYNKLQSVIILIQSLMRLEIRNNKLANINVSALINLQILDISHNQIEKIELDKLVKVKQLNLQSNEIQVLTLSNKQCQKLNLSTFCQQFILQQIGQASYFEDEKIKRIIYKNKFEQLVLENTQLQILNISHNKLKEVNIQKLINLKQLKIDKNKLSNLTLTNQKLQYLDISQNQLTSVNFKALVHLKFLDISGNKLQQLYLDYPLLQTLYVSKNELQKIDLSKLGKLKVLNASRNQLTQFPEIGIESLQKLQINYNKLKKINLNGYTNLRVVDISQNQIDEFVVGDLAIQRIQASNNKIKKVDIIKLNKIRYIDFSANKIQQIVLKNESLQKIQLYNNRIYNINIDKLSNLKQLYLSNNCITSIHIKKENNPKLKYLELNNQKFRYKNYFLEKLLTKQQLVRYKQQKQKTKADDGQILTKLGFSPFIEKKTFFKIIQSINDQYDKKIKIEDRGQQ